MYLSSHVYDTNGRVRNVLARPGLLGKVILMGRSAWGRPPTLERRAIRLSAADRGDKGFPKGIRRGNGPRDPASACGIPSAETRRGPHLNSPCSSAGRPTFRAGDGRPTRGPRGTGRAAKGA